MTVRLISSLAIATVLLASCTPMNQEKYPQYHYGKDGDPVTLPVPERLAEPVKEKTLIPITDPHGVNMNMMDARLQQMVTEADDIEQQVAVLVERLRKLRDDISGLAFVNKVSMVADPAPNPVQEAELLQPISRTEIPKPPVASLPRPESVTQSAQPPKAQAQLKPVATDFVVEEKIAPVTAKENVVTPKLADGVVSVRDGVHSNKTRLVFDVNGSTKHSVAFDKEAGVLTLKLPNTKWSTAKNRTYKLSQLSGYEAKPDGDGTIIALAVKGTSAVKVEALGKSGNRPARLVVDLIK